MKRLTMLLLLCVFFLAGCGAEKQAAEVKLPYLTKEERAELEQGLVDSLRLAAIDGTGSLGLVGYYCQERELENVSDYQLSDIVVQYTLSGEQVFSLSGLPPHTVFHDSVGWYSGSGEKQRMKAEEMEYRYDISYTVGAFNYLIPDCQILPEEDAEKAEEEHKITVDVKTDQGIVTLRIPDLEPVTLKGSVEGIRTGSIRTISEGSRADYYHAYNKETGCFRGITLSFTGKDADKDYFIAWRLLDDKGLIRDTGTLRYDGDINFIGDQLQPGHYVLEFEELSEPYTW